MNKKYDTIREICEELWKFESENHLFDYKIHGINVWELVRLNVFDELSREFKIYGQAHSSVDSLYEKLKKSYLLFWNSIVKNPFLGKHKTDYLVYDHPRKVQINGSFIDIYTYYFINESNKKIDVIESPHLLTHFSTSRDRKNYRDHEILMSFIRKKLFPIKLTDKEKEKIKKIDILFKKWFETSNIDIYSIIVKKINVFKQQYNYHKKLIKKRQPQSVYIVVFYGKHSIIAAAKDLGVKVIEFQHGVINDYHFAYNFGVPNRKFKYFPDKILTFGEYWAKTKRFPNQIDIEVYGFPHLNNQLKKYKEIMKKERQILFISQGTIGKQLSKYAKNIAELMPQYNFKYKLHPGEYDRWTKEYPDLIKATKLDNFEVIDNNNEDLYKLLAESDFQIGVYSTALFEGLTLKCKTILIDLPGVEYMKDLVEKKIVAFAQNEQQIKTHITNFSSEKFVDNYFFNIH